MGISVFLGRMIGAALLTLIALAEPVQAGQVVSEGNSIKPIDEKNQDVSRPDPTVRIESLRFGGKSFEEWQSIARTDLKPESRVEALQAVGTFGINGRSKEAARTIVEIAAFYDTFSEYASDKVVVKCACEEMVRLGTESVPALQQSLKGGKLFDRQFAAFSLNKLGAKAKAAEPTLISALQDVDFHVRIYAALALQNFSNHESKEYAKSLAEVLFAGDSSTFFPVLRSLAKQGPKARSAVPVLAKYILEKNWNPDFSCSIGSTILEIGDDEKEMVPIYKMLLKLLLSTRSFWSPDWRKGKFAGSGDMTDKILKDVTDLGKNAKELAPALVEFYQGTYATYPSVLKTLIAIEADPADVIPLIKAFLEPGGSANSGQPKDEELNKILEHYLREHVEKMPRTDN